MALGEIKIKRITNGFLDFYATRVHYRYLLDAEDEVDSFQESSFFRPEVFSVPLPVLLCPSVVSVAAEAPLFGRDQSGLQCR